MTTTTRLLPALIAVCIIGCNRPGNTRAATDEKLSAATIVVFNRNLPESAELAKFYAQKRRIAPDHLVGLKCSAEEEISREEYDANIAQPLREAFDQKHWWTVRIGPDRAQTAVENQINFVAVIKGVPLKIRPTTDYPGDLPDSGPTGNRNEASVDSELATLGNFSRRISGAMPNPYCHAYRSIADFKDPALLLVCRLDAPSSATVRRMITDAIDAEESGLWGRAYVDGAHNETPGYAEGDRWLNATVTQFHKAGVPVVFDDQPATFPDGFPMSDCSLYYGWYAANICGPFLQPDFHFVRGAVAVHIHSYSANTLRDPKANWVAPLLTKGAAASLGNVYEPYLQLTADLGIFNDRLLHGFTLAESAYMATRGLSWMGVIVGDPLYRPFASWVQIDSGGKTKQPNEWKMYHDFAVKNAGRPEAEYRDLARQVASRARNGAMIEDLGLMEMQGGNFTAATSYFLQARASYTKRDDILRAALEEADSWIKQKKPKRALDLIRSVLAIVQDAPASALLRQIEQQLNPPPARPPAPR